MAVANQMQSETFRAIKERKTAALGDVLQTLWSAPPGNLLVVGCGRGEEAGELARRFGINTIGIDICDEDKFDRQGASPATLEKMDAQALKFTDNSFDMVYTFHALEHMSDPNLALQEMARVLRPGGFFVAGTPNKKRLLGYIGSATTLANKIKWNMNDWRDRLRGKWRNEDGAHAGFNEPELHAMCREAFGDDNLSLTDRYFLAQYGEKRIRPLIRSGLSRFFFPSIYIGGTNR